MFLTLIRRLAAYPRIMDKSKKLAVLSHHVNDKMFSFSFYLECPQPAINRQFNMQRSNDDTMEKFHYRLKENLMKVVAKKNKKAKKAKIDSDVKEEIDIISTELLPHNLYSQGGIDTMHKVLV